MLASVLGDFRGSRQTVGVPAVDFGKGAEDIEVFRLRKHRDVVVMVRRKRTRHWASHVRIDRRQNESRWLDLAGSPWTDLVRVYPNKILAGQPSGGQIPKLTKRFRA